MGLTREQVLLEYAKCVKSPEYALKTYLKTYDQTVQGFVPLKLFPDQVKLIEDFEKFEENIALNIDKREFQQSPQLGFPKS